MSPSRSKNYDTLQKLLHWSIAGLIVLQYVLARLAEAAGHGDAKLQQLALLANHKSVGITILMLAVVRLCWRALRGAPSLPLTMPAWQRRASHASHLLLYALLFALPLSGWLMSSASAYPVSWFGLFQLPDFVAADAGLKHQLEELHEFLAKGLFVIAAVHILAALKHGVIDRDGVLARISSFPALLTFIVVIAAGVAFLGRLDAAPPQSAADTATDSAPLAPNPAVETAPGTALPDGATLSADVAQPEATSSGAAAPPPAPVAQTPSPVAASDAPSTPAAPTAPAAVAPPAVWSIDYSRSRIEFSAEQAGARFSGRWSQWQATLRFDPQRSQPGRFEVAVQTDSAQTGDAERDAYLADSDWFDHARHPQATFTAERFERTGDGRWQANGRFSAKGRSTPLTLEFTVEADGERRTLRGTARIDRLAASIGTGEWTDTDWVGQFVDVSVEVVATVR